MPPQSKILLPVVLTALMLAGCGSDEDQQGGRARELVAGVEGEATLDWALAIDRPDSDLVGEMTPLHDGGVLAGTRRVGPTGGTMWVGNFPRGGFHRGSLPGGDIVVVGSKLAAQNADPNACELDVTGDAEYLATIDGEMGSCSGVVELTSGEPDDGSELWSGFANDSEGVYVFRAASAYVGAVEYHDYLGSRRWAIDHQLSSYAVAPHPDGGVVLAGHDESGPLVVRHIDSTGHDVYRRQIPDEGCVPVQLVSTHVSGGGAVVMAGLGTIHNPDPHEDIPTPRPDCVAVIDAAGQLAWRAEIPGRVLGAALSDDDHALVWSQDDSLDGWTLTSLDAAGEPLGSWTVSAPDPYAHSGGLKGQLLRRGGHVFVTGAYRDELDFGPLKLGRSEPMDYFLARFSLE